MVQPDGPHLIIRRTGISGWVPKATISLSEYVMHLFHSKNCYTNAHQCNVIRTMTVSFSFCVDS